MQKFILTFAFCLLHSALSPASAQTGLAPEQLVVSGVIGQYGIAADRTIGADTLFLGVLLSGDGADTAELLRTTDVGQSWTRIWQMPALNQTLSNLALHVVDGLERWVILAWVANDGLNNGDPMAARISFDGAQTQPLNPHQSGLPDTVDWLTLTGSANPGCTLHLFWQDEVGLAGAARNPVIRHTSSTDYGLTWSPISPVITGFETPACDYGGPGHIFIAARGVQSQDILSVRSTDAGRDWSAHWLTTHDSTVDNMNPSVAATHDSFSNGRVWVTYDVYHASRWQVHYAVSTNEGATWDTNRLIESPITTSQFWSDANCAGYGSRDIRVAYLSRDTSLFRVHYREGNGTNPEAWSPVVVVSSHEVSDAVPPVVANCGVSGRNLDTGLVFYTEPGPTNVWCNVYPFVGLGEDAASPSELGLRAGIQRGLLDVAFSLAVPSRVGLAVYGVDGRRAWARDAGLLSAGKHEARFLVPELSSGTYFVILRTRTGSINSRLVYCR
jgi:hypothetical protein